MDGAAFSGFLIVFRETLEASLIVGIILGFFSRIGAREAFKYVWTGVFFAGLASVLTAVIFEKVFGKFEGRPAEIFEGVVCLIAVAVLTYMIVWMGRQAAGMKQRMEAHLGAAFERREIIALVSFPFFSVLREGAETILFLKAASLQTEGNLFWGSLLGGAAAVTLVSSMFLFGKRIPLKPFFLLTSVLLLFMAAGLLAYGVHELEEAGLFPVLVEHVWDINHLLNDKEGAGALMKAVFGYNGNPSLGEVILYFSYLFTFGFLIYREQGARPAKAVLRQP
jgi:high-affinity iron transporter